MKAPAEKTIARQSKAATGASPARQLKQQSEGLFEDRRREAVGQRALAEKADSSPQAGRIAQLQALADGSATGVVQRLGLDEEEPLQGKFETIQRQEEEEELLQGKFETVQRQGAEEGEELLQGKFETIQRQGLEDEEIQAKNATVREADEEHDNNTGLPDTLKSGIESLSGMSMDDVKVHYNSAQPAQLNALAYAQGTDIHVASGQEKHLPHEAWHVVQQKQGRVQPSIQIEGGLSVNDDAGLEKEADLMGEKAASSIGNKNPIQMKRISQSQIKGMGFAGPYEGNTWQWNATGGIHVTIRREGGIVTHFHVRKDSKGGIYNRINYNENAGGDWVESDVNVPAGEELETEMKAIAADTIRLIKALVPPAN